MPLTDAVRRLPKSTQSTALLTGTSLVVFATLGTWLVIWLLFVRPKVEFVRAKAKAAPVALNALTGLFTNVAGSDGRNWSAFSLDSRTDDFRSFLDSHADRPMILYLAAPTIVGHSEVEGWKGVISFEANDDVNLKTLLEACLDRKKKAKLLLILDPGQVGTDPALGLFGNSIARELKRLGTPPENSEQRATWNERWRHFGILCACSPEQFSWPIEGLGRSVFDHWLNQELAQPRKIRVTIERVQSDVYRWVQENISSKAVQTPMYLGDPDLNFFVPGTKLPSLTAEEPSGRELESRNGLEDEYKMRDALEKRDPSKFAPAAWRHYQERLLQAERLFRARRWDDALTRLSFASDARKELTAPDDSAFHSLALGLRYAPDDPTILANDKTFEDFAKRLEVADEKDPRPSDQNPKETDLFLTIDQNPWHAYAEGQLFDWMKTYRSPRLDLDKDARQFTGLRSLFRQAARLRRRAETAAAAAFEPDSPLRRTIERGDEHRRTAQDLLFIGQGGVIESVEKELAEAKTYYDLANEFVDSMDLISKIQSELPFLGAWYVRKSARDGKTQFDTLKQIADCGRELNQALRDSELVEHAASGTTRVENLRKTLLLKSDSLRADFAEALKSGEEALKSGLDSTNWRLVDDLLLVPGIKAETRVKLVELARSFHRPPRASDANLAGAGNNNDDATRLVKSAVNRNLWYQARDEINRRLDGSKKPTSTVERPLGLEKPPGDADATYPYIAAGMARLEWTLLVLVSELRKDELKSLDDKIASIADREEKVSSEARAEFSRQLSAVRNKLRSRAEEEEQVGFRATELALAALPDHFTRDINSSKSRAWFRDLLTWMAGRMGEDFDLDRARKFLSAAGSRPDALTRRLAGLEEKRAIEVSSPDGQKLDLAPLPMPFFVKANAEVPDGKALLLVPLPKQNPPISLTLNEASVENGTEAAVKHRLAEPLTLVVNRLFGDRPAKAAGGYVDVTLKPLAFYRGRIFDGDLSKLTVNPIKSDFIITVESDRDMIKKRFNRDLPRDQFELHPDKGYVYPGWTHLCRFDLLYLTDTAGAAPVDVEVEWGLKNEGTPNVNSLTLKPNEKTNIVGGYEIQFDPPAMNKPKANVPILNEKEFVVKVWRKPRKPKGEPIAKKVFTFCQVNPERWNKVDYSLSQINNMEYQLSVKVTRGRDDPVVNKVSAKVVWPFAQKFGKRAEASFIFGVRAERASRDESRTIKFTAPADAVLDKNLKDGELDFSVEIAEHHWIACQVRAPKPMPQPQSQPEPPAAPAAAGP